MQLLPKTFNGHNINDSNYESWIVKDLPLQPGARGVFISRAGARPAYAGKTLAEGNLIVGVKVLGNYGEGFEQLNQWFNIEDDVPYTFAVTDQVDNRDYYCMATPFQMGSPDGEAVIIGLLRKDPVWKATTAAITTFAVTTNSQQQAVVNNGNANCYPVVTVTPTSSPSGYWPYAAYVTMYPNSTKNYPSRPVDITGGGWDTAALVSGGKMISTGADVRVTVNGADVDYWFGTGANAINTTQTKVWVVLDVPARRNMSLKTAITTAGSVEKISMKVTNANRKDMKRMPKSGIVMINSEQFSYDGKTVEESELSLTVSNRSIRNTSAASHANGDIVRLIPFNIQVYYGNSTATAPDIDDTTKPVIDLDSSNSQFTYTSFSDDDGLRAGAWDGEIVRVSNSVRSLSYLFTGDNDGGDTDPWEVCGMSIVPYRLRGVWYPETSRIEYKLHVPDGISSVDSYGNVYRVGGRWPSFSGMLSAKVLGTYVQEFDIASPTTASLWTPFTQTSVSFPTDSAWVIYRLRGSVNGVSTHMAKMEITKSVVNIANPPTISFGSEETSIALKFTLSNDTTGESVAVDFSGRTSSAVTIDTDPEFPNATVDGVYINKAIKLSSVRAPWLKLQPGTNTMSYTADITGNVDIVFSLQYRMNYQ